MELRARRKYAFPLRSFARAVSLDRRDITSEYIVEFPMRDVRQRRIGTAEPVTRAAVYYSRTARRAGEYFNTFVYLTRARRYVGNIMEPFARRVVPREISIPSAATALSYLEFGTPAVFSPFTPEPTNSTAPSRSRPSIRFVLVIASNVQLMAL